MKKVSIKPLQVNNAWQGKRFKTKEYKIFRETLALLLRLDKKFGKEKIGIRINLFLKNQNQQDVDNFLKPILDAMTDAKIFEDDRYIQKLEVEKFKSKDDYFEYEIFKLKN